MSWSSEEQKVWIKERSCSKKRPFSEKEALEIIKAKFYYAMYSCQYCNNFHLTKGAAHKKYKDSLNKADDDVTGIDT